MNNQQYQLTVSKGPNPGEVYELTSVSMTIGRDPMSEIPINDPEVSRRHARLIGTLSGYRIQDLGSTNGTFVDGVRLSGEPLDLESGQLISIGGGVALLFQAVGEDDDQSLTILDMDMATLTQSPTEDQPEFVADELIDNEFIAKPVISTENDDLYDEKDNAAIDSTMEDDEIVDANFTSTVADKSDQELGADPLPLATVWESPQEQESPSLEADQADSIEANEFSEPVVIPHQGESTPPPSPDQGSKYRRLSTIIAAVSLLIICCCCSLLLFLYYYGGDWMLRQMGLLP